MVFREVSVIEIREVLRSWLAGAGLRTVAARAGVDRKTARRHVEAAVAAGLARDGGTGQLTDELVGQVAEAVRPVRPAGHGPAWERLEGCRGQIQAWVKQGLTVVKIGVLPERQGVAVPYRALHRFCAERCGYGRAAATTVRAADGEPGAECQLDFGYLGLLADPVPGRQRKVHPLIFTACYSRHMCVWLSFTQTLAAFIAGCEGAWAFFGGVFRILVPDNASAIVAGADAVNPRFTAGSPDLCVQSGLPPSTLGSGAVVWESSDDLGSGAPRATGLEDRRGRGAEYAAADRGGRQTGPCVPGPPRRPAMRHVPAGSGDLRDSPPEPVR
jgi:transposase